MSNYQPCSTPNKTHTFLSQNSFRFYIHKIPDVTYYCQESSIPTVSLPTPKIATPLIPYPVPGDIMNFEPLQIKFLVDSDLMNYKHLFAWIRGMGFPDSHKQFTDEVNKGIEFPRMTENQTLTSDAVMAIYNNTNALISLIEFRDCIVTSLAGLGFTSTNPDVNYLIGEATFVYTSYTFKELDDGSL